MKKKLTSGQKQRRRIIIGLVETQIKEHDPPETGQTLERLMLSGYSREDARELIALVVASEIFDVLKQEKPFNRERFVNRLNNLPKLPED